MLHVTGMDGFRKKFWESEPNLVGVKVAQLNVLLELQLSRNFISHFPNVSVVS